jgi:hypothetical protein
MLNITEQVFVGSICSSNQYPGHILHSFNTGCRILRAPIVVPQTSICSRLIKQWHIGGGESNKLLLLGSYSTKPTPITKVRLKINFNALFYPNEPN